VAQDPDAGAADLRRVVEGDPALAARVLRVVNSAACGVCSTVTSLHQAISYLGFNQVRNLALTASVSEIFKKDVGCGTYQRHELWRHLVAVGVCARLVAVRCGMSNFEDAFLAGLLHDIGIILEDQYVHEGFCRVLGDLAGQPTLSAVEERHLGFDHCALGFALAELWRFPPAVRAAIRYHHATDDCDGESRDIVHCVEVANMICSVKGITSVGEQLVQPPLRALQVLRFDKDDIVVLATDLDQELATCDSLFEL
jgi:putative nucleotidyltransferase with HDIG domain